MQAPSCRSSDRPPLRRSAVRVAALAGAFAVAIAASAGPAAGEGARWSFSLPALDGERFLGPADFRGPVLVNVWGIDCPPCVAELPRLQAFALAHPDWTVLLVATDAPADARRFLQQRGIALPAVRAGAAAAGLMRQAGNRSGALPFSAAVRDGRICRAGTGEWHGADLGRAVAACGNAAAPAP
jgi:outer membrane receptor for ferrienterochelin and colicins